MNGRFHGARRHRGLLILVATVLVALAGTPSAQSTQGQPVIAGQYNGSTSPTELENTTTGGTTLMAFGVSDGNAISASTSGNGIAIDGSTTLGVAVKAVNTSATNAALFAENRHASGGSAIEALNRAPNWAAIYGHHDAASSGYGVYGEAPIGIGVQGRGSVQGVRGFTDSAAGTGVLAENTAGGTALKTMGAVRFSTAGIATILSGQKQVTVAAGVDVTAETKVLVTTMTTGGTFKFVERDPAGDKLIFNLAKPATRAVALAYFVIS